MATGIRDKVAILSMGCSRFGERWDCSPEDLMLEAFNEALAEGGVTTGQIEAAWLGVCLEENNVGKTAGPLAQALRLPGIAATRVENACATGSEALRGRLTRWPLGPTTSCWHWGSRNSKTPVTVVCPFGRGA